MDDLKLLREYAQTRSQAAFARIVASHVDMVYSTCLRQLHDRHAAEDATQAVFITLAQKAGRLKDGTVVAGWLYRAARLHSAEAIRKSKVRRKHEMAAAGLKHEADHQGNPATNSFDAELDEALERLGESERQAILLRYFQGRSFSEVAVETGTSEEAARKRVSRAIERLRTLLRPASGVTISAAAVETVLSASIHPAPPELAAATLKALSTLPAASAGGPLTKGVIVAMALTKAQAAVTGVVLIALAGGAYLTYKNFAPRREQVVVIPETGPTHPTSTGEGWRQRFDEVYGLKDGENVKQVSELIPERQLFWSAQNMNSTFALQPGKDTLTVEWDNGKPHWTSVSLSVPNLGQALQMGAHLQRWQVQDPSLPMLLPFKGDWAFRKHASPQQIMDGLAPIVSARLGRQVRFEVRKREREVLVVRGSYHFTPLNGQPSDNRIDYIGDPAPDDNAPPRVENKTLRDIFNSVESDAATKVFDESGAGDTQVTVRTHWRPINSVDRLIQNLQAQTGLQFVREKRPLDLWCMVDSQGKITSSTPPDFDQKYALADGEVVRRVNPPFGPERTHFLEIEKASQKSEKMPPSLLLTFDGATHLRYPSENLKLSELLQSGMDIDAKTLDASVPVNAMMEGDWVIRQGTSADERLAAMGPILSRQLARPVHFERRRLPADVIVVTGAPAEKRSMLVLSNQVGTGPQVQVFHTPLRQFLASELPVIVNKRVIDQTSSPDTKIEWQWTAQGALPPDAAIKAVADATGLQLKLEKREMDMIVLADGPGPLANGQ